MKCMVLAGGKGSRLGALTAATNKHLLPVGDKPMILHSFSLLYAAGFKDALLVTNAENVGDFMNLVKADIHPLDKLDLYITPQRNPDGISDAIRYGEGFCRRGPVLVILGDNVFELRDIERIKLVIEEFGKNPVGAHVWTKDVDNPEDYGVLEIGDDDIPTLIVEKPQEPTSTKAVAGIYLFDERVWDIIPTLSKSDRGEYEITDIIREYFKNGPFESHELEGEWHDLGRSIESYYQIASRIL